MTHNHTISIHFAQAVLSAVKRDDIRLKAMLSAAGISMDLYSMARTRLTPQQFSRLLKIIATTLNDELLGLSNTPMPIGSFSLLARNALPSQNLLQVYKNTSLALRALSNPFALKLTKANGRIHLGFITNAKQIETSIILIELILLIWHRFPCWLVGQVIPIVEINLPYQRPDHAIEYPLLFSTNINFGCQQTEIVIAERFVNLPCIRTAEELATYIHKLPEVWFKRMRFNHDEHLISELCLTQLVLGDKINMPALAKNLNISVRTLRRKLANEQLTFNQLKEHFLRDNAIHLLLDGNSSIENIANTLGYTEASAFSRAFKQWTGSSPKAYRHSVLNNA